MGRVPGVINVDMVAHENVDVVKNLDVFPWPWGDDTVQTIMAQDLFEHLDQPVGFMTEAYRVLELGGTLALRVPHFRHQNAFTDPTHKRFCTPHTWDYWIPGTELYKRHYPMYGKAAFVMARQEISAGAIFTDLRKISLQ